VLVSMPWLMAGCVVPDPEKFPEPKRGAPVLQTERASPTLDEIKRVVIPSQETFSVPFRSEDAGERPVALLYLDLNTPGERFLGSDAFQQPSTFDDPEIRTFSVTANFEGGCGNRDVDDTTKEACCHRATMLVTHESNLVRLDGGPPKPDPSRSVGDLATVVWWLAVAEQGREPYLLGRCPTPTTPPVGGDQ
jgi:hypothetical protein